MKNLLKAGAVFLFLLPLQFAVAQSTNGNSTPNGRENWFPNRGNVGIGTRTPSEALEVLGNVRVSETVFTNNLETIGLKATTLNVSQNATIGGNLFVNGKVGIGVSNPTEKLDINGNVKVSNAITSDLLTVRQFTGTDGVVNNSLRVGQKFIVDGVTGLGVPSPTERLEVSGNIKATQGLYSDLINTGQGSFSRGVQVAQTLLVTGNTGLGVSSPSEKLEVAGNAKISQGLYSATVNTTDGFFGGNIKGDKNLIIDGLVGIGIASPAEKLEVSGNIKATQGLFANSAQITQDISAGKNLAVTGNVGIGVAPGTDKLSVAGSAYVNGLLTAENITVKQKLDIKGTFSLAGSLGIGVANPEAPLHVSGDGKFEGDIRANKIIVNSIEIAGASSNGSSVSLGDNLLVNGSIGIGTTKVSGYKLSVNGKIRASDDIKVYIESEWSDFVFEKDYHLRSLEEVDAYIKKHGHLPEIPSAAAVKSEGFDLGAMDAKLLQKIEEITLHLIDLKKENDILKKEVNRLTEKSNKN